LVSQTRGSFYKARHWFRKRTAQIPDSEVPIPKIVSKLATELPVLRIYMPFWEQNAALHAKSTESAKSCQRGLTQHHKLNRLTDTATVGKRRI
jgi:hypothetical protein